MSQTDVERIRNWAVEKNVDGQKRRICIHRCAELRQAVDSFLAELDALKEETSLREPSGKKAEHLLLVWSRPETLD
jgi:hypothetical protein